MISFLIPFTAVTLILCTGHVLVYFLATQIKKKIIEIEKAVEDKNLAEVHKVLLRVLVTLNGLTIAIVISFSALLSLWFILFMFGYFV